MILIDQLRTQENFSYTEIIIANYILDHLKTVPEMTISTLAENTFCSIATISRFCKKLKYANFNTFKLELATQNYSDISSTKRVAYDFPFDEHQSKEQIAETVLQLSHQTLYDSAKHIDLESIIQAARLISQSDQIDIYANGNSLVTAIDLHNKLLWMGKNSHLEMIRGFHTIKAQSSSNKRIAIIISYYGTGQTNIKIAKLLHQTKTPYLLITGPKLNPLCVHASVVISVTPLEDNISKMAPISSRIAMTYASDLLYSLLFSLDFNKNKKTIHEHDHQPTK